MNRIPYLIIRFPKNGKLVKSMLKPEGIGVTGMKIDAIFEGGGVRAIGFVGAVCFMEEKNFYWQRLAGTSAGSIIASLLAVGYTGKELYSIISDMDYSKFLDVKGIQAIPLLGKPLGLLFQNGMYRGDYIEQWMQGLLYAKGKTKFKDVMLDGECRLKIIASDISKRKILIFPDNLPDYGIDPMEFEIAKAVRMSAGIPICYNPIKLNYKDGVSYIVDGGILSNFPVWIFDVNETPRWPTFGFRFIDPKERISSAGSMDLLTYISEIFESVVEEDQSLFMKDKDSVRVIPIPTWGIQSTNFNISQEESFKLYLSGYESCKKFLNQWNFSSYMKKYR